MKKTKKENKQKNSSKNKIKLLELIEALDKKKFEEINKKFEVNLPEEEDIEKWVKATEKINEWIWNEFVKKYKDYSTRSEKFYEEVKSKLKNVLKKAKGLSNPIEKMKKLDPFSLYNFIYSEEKQRIKYIEALSGIEISSETRFPIPTCPPAMRYPYFKKREKREVTMKYCWEFFEVIWDLKEYVDLRENKDKREKFIEMFDKGIKEIEGFQAPKLTQNLYYIKPHLFVPLRSEYDKIFDDLETGESLRAETYLKFLERSHNKELKNLVSYPTVWLSHLIYSMVDMREKVPEISKEIEKTKKGKIAPSEMVDILKQNKQIIFYGPPGTGKTYLAREMAKQIIGEKFEESPRYKLVVFHPSFEYEQFIRGLRPVTDEKGNISFKTFEGHFLILCWRALFLSYLDLKKNNCEKHKGINKENIVAHTECIADDFQKNCVLIIDEINRGNLPLLLGELIYGIEKDKRGTKIDLPYEMPESGEEILNDISENKEYINEFWEIFKKEPRSIYIPHNLFIIGTMNTSDRSIGTIDAAIRRRFAFKYIGPDESKIENEKLKNVLKKINELFIEDEKGEIRVGGAGHSYFMGDDKNIKNNIEYFLIPLLREYYELGVAGEKNEELKEIIKRWEKSDKSEPIERLYEAVVLPERQEEEKKEEK